jgi:hypothetical protein
LGHIFYSASTAGVFVIQECICKFPLKLFTLLKKTKVETYNMDMAFDWKVPNE